MLRLLDFSLLLSAMMWAFGNTKYRKKKQTMGWDGDTEREKERVQTTDKVQLTTTVRA